MDSIHYFKFSLFKSVLDLLAILNPASEISMQFRVVIPVHFIKFIWCGLVFKW